MIQTLKRGVREEKHHIILETRTPATETSYAIHNKNHYPSHIAKCRDNELHNTYVVHTVLLRFIIFLDIMPSGSALLYVYEAMRDKQRDACQKFSDSTNLHQRTKTH